MAPQVGLEPTTLRLTAACSTDWAIEECRCARRVIFPGRRQPSIVTVNELNYCVRNGNRCTLITIDTHYVLNKSAFVWYHIGINLSRLKWWPVGESNSRLRRERPPSWPLDQRATSGLWQSPSQDWYTKSTFLYLSAANQSHGLKNMPPAYFSTAFLVPDVARRTRKKILWCTIGDSNPGPTD